MYVHDKVNIFPANRLTFFRKVPFGKDYLISLLVRPSLKRREK